MRADGPVPGGLGKGMREPEVAWVGSHISGRRTAVVRLSFRELLGAIGCSVEACGARPSGSLALQLSPGRWSPPSGLFQGDQTLLVVSGGLVRQSPLGTELLLRGDVRRVGSPSAVRWRVVSRPQALVGVLGAPTVAVLATVPGVARALLRAVLNQHEDCLELRSIVSRYDVRERIVRLFALLGRRVGQAQGEAVRIALDLEQKRIEEIIGAGHTQATASFRALAAAGVLVRDADGWLFSEQRWRALTRALPSSEPNTRNALAGSVPNSLSRIDPGSLALAAVDS
jgi:hypothetical protein